MDQDQINRLLRESANSSLEQAVRKELKQYIKVSSDAMSVYWERWEAHEKIYRGYRMPDKRDVEAVTKNEPIKLIIPITYAQIQTGLSFVMSVLAQREHFWELLGRGSEDQGRALALERDLDWQFTRNQGMLRIYLWLLDAFKLGFGVMKSEWVEEHARMRVQRPVIQTPQGMLSQMASAFGFGQAAPAEPEFEDVIEELLEYEGTKITPVRPYNFYPDPDFSLAKFQAGVFVAHEEETSLQTLQSEEGSLYHGTAHIDSDFSHDTYKERARYLGRIRDQGQADLSGFRKSDSGVEGGRLVVVTEFEFNLVPKQWSDKLDIDFGKDTRVQKWIATMANDQKIIRLQPANYLHGKFNYDIIEFSPDNSSFCNPGVSDTIHNLQNTMTWFLNSHISNVRKVIKNQFIGNPAGVYAEDIENNRSFIRTKGTHRSIDQVLKQLQVTDVTSGHVGDVEILHRLVQVVTGINENALGQYASGRRSATEARNVNAGAAARLKMHAALAWEQGLQPLGQKFVANTRQSRSRMVYDSILGDSAAQYPFDQVILADPQVIAANYDFKPFDASLPSEKQQTGQLLQELWVAFFQAPIEVQQHYNIDARLLLSRIAELYGIKNLSDFEFQQQRPIESQVVPDDQAAAMAAQGAEPVDVGGEDLLRQLAGGGQ